MPYTIVQLTKNPPTFKVAKQTKGKFKYYSKKPQTYEQSLNQLRALYRSESLKGYRGGEEMETAPTLNSQGIWEIPVQEFAVYQQRLAEEAMSGNPTIQSLSTLGSYGAIAQTGAELAGLIPEIGPFIEVGTLIANSLLGLFYTPRISIQNKLLESGIDIFLDQVVIVDPNYPDTDPKHYDLLLPNGMIADLEDQTRYSLVVTLLNTLGTNPAVLLSKISPEERKEAFPDDPTWNTKFNELAQVHGHANQFLIGKHIKK